MLDTMHASRVPKIAQGFELPPDESFNKPLDSEYNSCMFNLVFEKAANFLYHLDS